MVIVKLGILVVYRYDTSLLVLRKYSCTDVGVVWVLDIRISDLLKGIYEDVIAYNMELLGMRLHILDFLEMVNNTTENYYKSTI